MGVYEIPYKIRKYEKVDRLPKTGSIYFMFGPKLDIDTRNGVRIFGVDPMTS